MSFRKGRNGVGLDGSILQHRLTKRIGRTLPEFLDQIRDAINRRRFRLLSHVAPTTFGKHYFKNRRFWRLGMITSVSC